MFTDPLQCFRRPYITNAFHPHSDTVRRSHPPCTKEDTEIWLLSTSAVDSTD